MDSVESIPESSENVSHDPSLQDAVASDSARLGDALIAHTKLKQQDIDRVLAFQADKNILFGEAAIQLGLITKEDLQKALSEQFNYSYLHDGNQKLSQLLVAAHQPFSLEVEHLRSLRSQLLIRWFDQGNKSLAVTSVSQDEGASEFVANLAIIFSQLNKKTLLIDANLRQSKQHKLFNIETKVGLANILANRQGLYQLARQQSLPNLAILTAGTEVPNPQELLSQSALTDLLVDLEKIYEIILIDTSPLESGSDVLTVVSKVKAAVILTRKDVTAVADLQLLHQQLNMAGAQIVGSVLQDY